MVRTIAPLGQRLPGAGGALNWTGIPLQVKFFFQLVFAGTAATIVSGAIAERVRFLAFLFFSFVQIAVIYPITGHWVWGGGWLAQMGFFDFAGSTVVHAAGGWAALIGTPPWGRTESVPVKRESPCRDITWGCLPWAA